MKFPDNFANFKADFMRTCKKKYLRNCKNISKIFLRNLKESMKNFPEKAEQIYKNREI